jgi:hypothetical protein
LSATPRKIIESVHGTGETLTDFGIQTVMQEEIGEEHFYCQKSQVFNTLLLDNSEERRVRLYSRFHFAPQL